MSQGNALRDGGREEESRRGEGGGEGERESETCVIRVSSNIFLEKISLKKKTLDIRPYILDPSVLGLFRAYDHYRVRSYSIYI